MATPFLDDYAKYHSSEQIMAMVDLMLSYDPKNVAALTLKLGRNGHG